MLAWKVAGWWGLDRWLLPLLGTPWMRRVATVDTNEGKHITVPTSD
jgi:thiosulfate dehydrogenase [quinone] large subunit